MTFGAVSLEPHGFRPNRAAMNVRVRSVLFVVCCSTAGGGRPTRGTRRAATSTEQRRRRRRSMVHLLLAGQGAATLPAHGVLGTCIVDRVWRKKNLYVCRTRVYVMWARLTGLLGARLTAPTPTPSLGLTAPERVGVIVTRQTADESACVCDGQSAEHATPPFRDIIPPHSGRHHPTTGCAAVCV